MVIDSVSVSKRLRLDWRENPRSLHLSSTFFSKSEKNPEEDYLSFLFSLFPSYVWTISRRFCLTEGLKLKPVLIEEVDFSFRYSSYSRHFFYFIPNLMNKKWWCFIILISTKVRVINYLHARLCAKCTRLRVSESISPKISLSKKQIHFVVFCPFSLQRFFCSFPSVSHSFPWYKFV